MLRLRPYNVNDTDKILSWSNEERAFYKWSAGILGEYPISKEQCGFVVVDPEKRGKGYGKSMLQLGTKFAKEIFGAKKVSLGVFENNKSAYYCYKAVGFQDVVLEKTERYIVLGEEWKCLELEMDLYSS